MPSFRALPGVVQLVIAIVLITALWALSSLWIDDGTAGLVGIFVGGVLLTLWEAGTGGAEDE